METLNARTASLQIAIRGVDVSANLAPYVLGFTYTDNAHGKADEVQLTLDDRDGRWRTGWRPDKSDRMEASILCRDWKAPGDRLTLPCGSFAIDEVECSGSASGNVCTVKAVSSFIDTALRQEKKTRTWENATLRRVAGDIAAEHGLRLYHAADADPAFTRLDQREESDLAFMRRAAEERGLNLKVGDGQIVLFAGKLFDARPAVATLAYGMAGLSGWSFKTKAFDIYRACRVAYFDPETKAEKHCDFVPPDAPAVGQTLKVNTRVESLAAALERARSELRRHNQNEVEGRVHLMGDPVLLAGSNAAVTGFGKYDGRYAIETAVHAWSRASGYTTELTLRKTLEY